MTNKIACILFLGLTHIVMGQEVLKGRVVSNTGDVEGVYVVNAQTEVMVLTDESGSFSIAAKVGDALVFSSIQFKEVRILISEKDFLDLNFSVTLFPVVHQLQEVVIKRNNNINSVSLGIIPANQKHYTPAERKLYTATDLNATANAGTMVGGSVSADALINYLSGRTAMLKKELAVEKKEVFMKLLETMFNQDHFVNTLKIPVEYVKGFEYYVVENDKFTAILNSKNRTTVEFLLGELAVHYKEIIASENK